jgi:hypothetical protein
MKIGTVASPWRYDAATRRIGQAIQIGQPGFNQAIHDQVGAGPVTAMRKDCTGHRRYSSA